MRCSLGPSSSGRDEKLSEEKVESIEVKISTTSDAELLGQFFKAARFSDKAKHDLTSITHTQQDKAVVEL